MKHPARLILYPERASRRYVSVMVWPSKRQMIRAVRRDWPVSNRTVACTVNWVTDKRGYPFREVAEVHFAYPYLTWDTITHEFTHAAWEWARRVKCWIGNDRDEERFCQVLGELVESFVVKARALGLLVGLGLERAA